MWRSIVFVALLESVHIASGQAHTKRSAPKPPAPAVVQDEESVPGEGKAQKTACDIQAAHPADKNRPVGVAGVADGKIVSPAAIKACLQTTADAPEDSRYQFELGRAYWAGKQYEPALQAFLKAQEKEYAPAYFYLGQAYQRGLVKGEKPDDDFAVDLYQAAAAEGFLPAKDMLAPAEEEAAGPLKIDSANGYTKPEFLQALYDGKLDVLAKSRSDALIYAGGANNIVSQYSDELAKQTDETADAPEPDKACIALTDTATQKAISFEVYGIPENPTIMDALKMATDKDLLAKLNNPSLKELSQAGIDDMFLLLVDSGGCSSAPAREVMKNLNSFVQAKK